MEKLRTMGLLRNRVIPTENKNLYEGLLYFSVHEYYLVLTPHNYGSWSHL